MKPKRHSKELYEQLVESLAFSKHNLDEAVLNQSELFFAVSEEYAKACSYRDEAKKNMEESYARVSLRIRDQFAEEGKKVTEDLIKQFTLLDDDYKESINNYLNCKLNADLWDALKDSYSSRGYMIKEIAELWRSSYFATTSITTPSTAAGEIQYEATRALIGEKRLLKKR